MKPVILNAQLTLSAKTTLALAATHIARYAGRIESKSKHVNVEETTALLRIWRDVRSRVQLGQLLDSEHVQELLDAVYDSNFDCLLTAEEFRAAHRKAQVAS